MQREFLELLQQGGLENGMYCKKCGKEGGEKDLYCGNCGVSLGQEQKPQIPTYLAWSILTTLICCPPTGIIALIYSSTVSSKILAGDYAGAAEASKKAKLWCWVTLVAGIVVQLLTLIFGSALLLNFARSMVERQGW